jgi:hypothetical protein
MNISAEDQLAKDALDLAGKALSNNAELVESLTRVSKAADDIGEKTTRIGALTERLEILEMVREAFERPENMFAREALAGLFLSIQRRA